ncbi:hypothetical protein ACIBAG_18355 [Streptomyces sp. NPDC051243]|uniref:hypothetical protein n=1 Tax=Streptomyces sp. NPDC051243 TaxID=3365646 RepID=UPI00379F6BC4
MGRSEAPGVRALDRLRIPVQLRTGSRPPTRRTPRRFRTLLTPGLLLLLAPPLLTAAHHTRPTPYGDHLTTHVTVPPHAHHATTPHAPPPQRTSTPHLRTTPTAIEVYAPHTGTPLWRYTREGRRPLTSLPLTSPPAPALSSRSSRSSLLVPPPHARVDVITLWDDGMVTDTDGRTVRWHRALPAARDWLAARGGTGVLRPLGRGMLAVVTPRRVAAYRIADGDLRWVLPAREGCAFEPARAERHGEVLLLAQPCPRAAWTAQLIALDDLGRITPHRKPLGNEVRGEGAERASEHVNPEKVVARPR